VDKPLPALADLGSLGEFVASIAVLITLLFLALQMRRSTAEIKLRNDMDRSGSTVQAGIGLMGANAVEAYTKALRHPSDLTEYEVMQVWAYLDVFIAGAASTWSAYKRGLAGSDDWLSAKSHVHYTLSFPVGVAIWNQVKRAYDREMTDEIDAYLTEHGVDRIQRHFERMLDDIRRLPAVPV
jgi:hypothetical protein